MAYNSNYKQVQRKDSSDSQTTVWVYNNDNKAPPELPQGVGDVRQAVENLKENGDKFDLEERQALLEKAVNAILDYLINDNSLTESIGVEEYVKTQELIQKEYEKHGFDHQMYLVGNLLSKVND